MRTVLRMIVVAALASGAALGQEPGPKLVAAWPSGPMEVRVAFDRAVDPSLAVNVVGRGVEFGEAGKPGGRVGGEKGTLKVAGARLVDDGRTLVLVTDPHPRESSYRLAIPGVKSPRTAGNGATIDVAYDLGGVEVAWVETGQSKPSWSGWWPEVEPLSVFAAVEKSGEHERLWPLTDRLGRLTLRTLVKLPAGSSALTADASSAFETTYGQESARSDGAHHASFKAEPAGEASEFSLAISTNAMSRPRVGLGATSADRASNAPLHRSAFLLPWAPTSPPPAPAPEIPPGLITGGDPIQGRLVFYGEAAKCATCHKVRDQGGAVGPELSNLVGRDRAWIYQNIVEPSASIHPEFVSYTVAMKDGTIAMGVVKADGPDALKVGDIDAKQTVIPRSEVEEIRPSTSSIMPVGLLGAIGEDRTRDLLAFLTTAPPPTPDAGR